MSKPRASLISWPRLILYKEREADVTVGQIIVDQQEEHAYFLWLLLYIWAREIWLVYV